jgi:hypothetical protein
MITEAIPALAAQVPDMDLVLFQRHESWREYAEHSLTHDPLPVHPEEEGSCSRRASSTAIT